jgi:CubicO group peptidase (beta-lactamase class C family)
VRLALASLLLAGSAAAQQPQPVHRPDPVAERLQRTLDSLRSVSGSPGITLGVALPDGRVLGLASGMSDTARRTPLEPDDLLLAGSVGKTFFAALALSLVQEGGLSLDAPISTWLGSEPWFARLPNGAAITVRMLMNHTSGLVRYEFKETFTVWPGADGPMVGHSGFFPGSLTEMRYFTGGRFAVALQLNTSNGRALRARPAAMVNVLAAVLGESIRTAR